jgi:hypothetical protein
MSDAREIATEYIRAVGERRFDRLEELLHPDVEFGGATARELRGAPTFIAALRRLTQILDRNDIREVVADGDRAAVLYDFVTDTTVGPVLSAEWLKLESGRIRSITLLFDWRRWPEVLNELERRTGPVPAADG